jgi:carnitine 3-dehydrogenase
MTTSDVSVEQVAILGCGLIGASWAALVVDAGITVTAWDPDEKVRANFSARVAELANTTLHSQYLSVADSLADAVANADLIQENAPERLDVKHALYRQIEDAAPAYAIISSSTSSFILSELADGAAHPERFVTAHPFNPAHIVPLVELFGTDAAVVDAAEVFYTRLGKSVVRMKREAHGHIANRLSSALWREAVHIVAEGIADVAAVDQALKDGPGLRWAIQGSHLTYHLGGGDGGIAHYLKHLGPSQERRWEALGTPTLDSDTCEALINGVAAVVQDTPISELNERRDKALRVIIAMRGNLLDRN